MAERAKLLDDLPVSVKRTLADRRVAAEEEAMDPHTLDFKKKQKLFESLAKSLSPPTVMQEAQLRHQMEQTYARVKRVRRAILQKPKGKTGRARGPAPAGACGGRC